MPHQRILFLPCAKCLLMLTRIHLPIGTDFNAPICIDPGKVPDIYEIESIEIRTDGIAAFSQAPIKGSS